MMLKTATVGCNSSISTHQLLEKAATIIFTTLHFIPLIENTIDK